MKHSFADIIQENTMITGGHFLLGEQGPNLNAGTIESFRQAVRMYAEAKKNRRKIGLGLLINDIGSVCDATSCSLAKPISRDTFQIPAEYAAILQENHVATSKLMLFWERHMRNRAKKLLHKQLAKGSSRLLYENGEYHYKDVESGISIILTRRTDKDKYGIPACPLIMAAFAHEQQRMGFPLSINFYYADEQNHLNVSNHYVIEKGKYVAQQFSNDFDIKNIYLFEGHGDHTGVSLGLYHIKKNF